jgi:SAM-dependent methyltransferase
VKALDLAPELARVASQALQTRYSSFSSTDQSETGNRYQAVTIGARTTRGERKPRGHVLDVLDLEGKRILDLGSNLGEMSRLARARGAALVDGFEYDPYFIEVANFLNVIADTSRVSFFERDISDPAIYTECYDIVFAFSVMRFMAGCVDEIAAITDVMLVEGHTQGGNFERRLRRLAERFPAYRMLGESDIDPAAPDDRRPMILFAVDEERLIATLAPHLRAGGRAAGAMVLPNPVRYLPGSVDVLSVEEGHLRIEGWCLDPDAAHDTVELSAPLRPDRPGDLSVVAVSAPRERADVEAALPAVAHARRSGFAFDHPLAAGGEGPVRLEITAYRGSEALGTMPAWYLDGMYEPLPEPPPGLAERDWGTADPQRLALASLGVASAMLGAVDRYVRLATFRSVLDLGCGLGLLERYVPRLVPGAAVTGAGWDEEALAWARTSGVAAAFEAIPDAPPTGLAGEGFDMVLAHRAMDRLPPERHADWRDELHRVAMPGAWIALSGRATPAREAIAFWSARFDVVSHLAAAVDGRYDLILLRRPQTGA